MLHPARPRPPLAALPVLLAVAMLACACAAAPISPEVLGQVNRQVGIADLLANPQAYEGQAVLLGGQIIETQNLPKVTEIEVLELPLDGDERPQVGDASGGRFLVLLNGYADPAIYSKGKLITVAGRVVGSQLRPIGEVEYRYPVLEALQVHLWQGRQYGYPNVFFSIGVGTVF